MKRKRFLAGAASLAAGMLWAGSAPAAIEPTVDGQLFDWMQEFTPVSKLVIGPGPVDPAQYSYLATEQGLFAAVVVEDNATVVHDGTHQSDSVEIYLNGDGIVQGDPSAPGWAQPGLGVDEVQFAIGADGTGFRAYKSGQFVAIPSGVLAAAAPTGFGYAVEFFVPWSVLGTSYDAVVSRGSLGLDIGINDCDGGTTRDRQVMWHGTGDNWKDPNQWGFVPVEFSCAAVSTCVAGPFNYAHNGDFEAGAVDDFIDLGYFKSFSTNSAFATEPENHTSGTRSLRLEDGGNYWSQMFALGGVHEITVSFDAKLTDGSAIYHVYSHADLSGNQLDEIISIDVPNGTDFAQQTVTLQVPSRSHVVYFVARKEAGPGYLYIDNLKITGDNMATSGSFEAPLSEDLNQFIALPANVHRITKYGDSYTTWNADFATQGKDYLYFNPSTSYNTLLSGVPTERDILVEMDANANHPISTGEFFVTTTTADGFETAPRQTFALDLDANNPLPIAQRAVVRVPAATDQASLSIRNDGPGVLTVDDIYVVANAVENGNFDVASGSFFESWDDGSSWGGSQGYVEAASDAEQGNHVKVGNQFQGMGQVVSGIHEGATYLFSAKARSEHSDTIGHVEVVFLDANYAAIANSGQKASVTTQTWSTYTFETVAPAGAQHALVMVYLVGRPGWTPTALYVDDYQLFLTQSVPYFDN